MLEIWAFMRKLTRQPDFPDLVSSLQFHLDDLASRSPAIAGPARRLSNLLDAHADHPSPDDAGQLDAAMSDLEVAVNSFRQVSLLLARRGDAHVLGPFPLGGSV